MQCRRHARPRALWSSAPIPGALFRSSGTTGEPLVVAGDLYGLHYNSLLVRSHFARRWPQLGVDFRPLRPAMAEITAAYPWEPLEAQQVWCLLPSAGLAGHVRMPFTPDKDVLGPIADFVERARPPVLTGMPSMLAQFAAAARERLGARRLSGPRAVMTSGEPLAPARRAELSEFFGAPVVDEYSMSELGTVGLETPGRPGFLVDDSTLIVEVLDEHLRPLSPGRTGLLCFTSLRGFKMPLIRYAPGDVGRLAAAPDGAFTRIETLEGRAQDLFVRRDGGIVHWENLSVLVAEHASVGRFQLIQESLSRVRLRTAAEVSAADRVSLEAALRRALGEPALSVVFEVGSFEEGRKPRPFISRVS